MQTFKQVNVRSRALTHSWVEAEPRKQSSSHYLHLGEWTTERLGSRDYLRCQLEGPVSPKRQGRTRLVERPRCFLQTLRSPLNHYYWRHRRSP